MGDNDTLQPNIRRNNGFEVRDDVSWTHGRFTHEFGADYWRYYLAGVTDTFSNGQFQFGSDNGFGQNATGSGFSDFLLDRPRVSLIQLGNGYGHFRYNYLGAYYAGQFRATPRSHLELMACAGSSRPRPPPSTGPHLGARPGCRGHRPRLAIGTDASLNDPLTQYFINNFGTNSKPTAISACRLRSIPPAIRIFAPRLGFAWDAWATRAW